MRELLEQIQRREADGSFAVSDEQVKDLMAFMLLSALAADPAIELRPVEEVVLLEFGARAGLSGGETPQQVQQAIAAYLTTLQLDETVALAAEQTARGLAREGARSVGEAYARFADQRRKLQPLEQAERPSGTVAAGPGARFQLQPASADKSAKKKPKRRRRR